MTPNAAEIDAKREPKIRRVIDIGHLDGRCRGAAKARKLRENFSKILSLNGKLTDAQLIAIERASSLVVLAEDSRARRLARSEERRVGKECRL